MERQGAHMVHPPVESNDADNDDSSVYGGADTPTQPRHDVLYVPDFPARSTRSGLTCDS
jgi:hypothetical protein